MLDNDMELIITTKIDSAIIIATDGITKEMFNNDQAITCFPQLLINMSVNGLLTNLWPLPLELVPGTSVISHSEVVKYN